MDRGWAALASSELSGEEWTDSLASIRPVGNTVPGPIDSEIDRLWSARFLIVRSSFAKGLSFAENILRAAPEQCGDHTNQESIPVTSLSAVSGAPRDATVRSCMLLAGRFGYSDLKEAALMEAYVLCIGLSGCRGIRHRLSWVGSPMA